MLFGLPPFYNENMDRMFELIRFAELKFPKKIPVSNEAKDLMTKVSIISIKFYYVYLFFSYWIKILKLD
jgi:hypothetical protein